MIHKKRSRKVPEIIQKTKKSVQSCKDTVKDEDKAGPSNYGNDKSSISQDANNRSVQFLFSEETLASLRRFVLPASVTTILAVVVIVSFAGVLGVMRVLQGVGVFGSLVIAGITMIMCLVSLLGGIGFVSVLALTCGDPYGQLWREFLSIGASPWCFGRESRAGSQCYGDKFPTDVTCSQIVEDCLTGNGNGSASFGRNVSRDEADEREVKEVRLKQGTRCCEEDSSSVPGQSRARSKNQTGVQCDADCVSARQSAGAPLKKVRAHLKSCRKNVRVRSCNLWTRQSLGGKEILQDDLFNFPANRTHSQCCREEFLAPQDCPQYLAEDVRMTRACSKQPDCPDQSQHTGDNSTAGRNRSWFPAKSVVKQCNKSLLERDDIPTLQDGSRPCRTNMSAKKFRCSQSPEPDLKSPHSKGDDVNADTRCHAELNQALPSNSQRTGTDLQTDNIRVRTPYCQNQLKASRKNLSTGNVCHQYCRCDSHTVEQDYLLLPASTDRVRHWWDCSRAARNIRQDFACNQFNLDCQVTQFCRENLPTSQNHTCSLREQLLNAQARSQFLKDEYLKEESRMLCLVDEYLLARDRLLIVGEDFLATRSQMKCVESDLLATKTRLRQFGEDHLAVRAHIDFLEKASVTEHGHLPCCNGGENIPNEHFHLQPSKKDLSATAEGFKSAQVKQNPYTNERPTSVDGFEVSGGGLSAPQIQPGFCPKHKQCSCLSGGSFQIPPEDLPTSETQSKLCSNGLQTPVIDGFKNLEANPPLASQYTPHFCKNDWTFPRFFGDSIRIPTKEAFYSQTYPQFPTKGVQNSRVNCQFSTEELPTKTATQHNREPEGGQGKETAMPAQTQYRCRKEYRGYGLPSPFPIKGMVPLQNPLPFINYDLKERNEEPFVRVKAPLRGQCCHFSQHDLLPVEAQFYTEDHSDKRDSSESRNKRQPNFKESNQFQMPKSGDKLNDAQFEAELFTAREGNSQCGTKVDPTSRCRMTDTSAHGTHTYFGSDLALLDPCRSETPERVQGIPRIAAKSPKKSRFRSMNVCRPTKKSCLQNRWEHLYGKSSETCADVSQSTGIAGLKRVTRKMRYEQLSSRCTKMENPTVISYSLVGMEGSSNGRDLSQLPVENLSSDEDLTKSCTADIPDSESDARLPVTDSSTCQNCSNNPGRKFHDFTDCSKFSLQMFESNLDPSHCPTNSFSVARDYSPEPNSTCARSDLAVFADRSQSSREELGSGVRLPEDSGVEVGAGYSLKDFSDAKDCSHIYKDGLEESQGNVHFNNVRCTVSQKCSRPSKYSFGSKDQLQDGSKDESTAKAESTLSTRIMRSAQDISLRHSLGFLPTRGCFVCPSENCTVKDSNGQCNKGKHSSTRDGSHRLTEGIPVVPSSSEIYWDHFSPARTRSDNQRGNIANSSDCFLIPKEENTVVHECCWNHFPTAKTSSKWNGENSSVDRVLCHFASGSPDVSRHSRHCQDHLPAAGTRSECGKECLPAVDTYSWHDERNPLAQSRSHECRSSYNAAPTRSECPSKNLSSTIDFFPVLGNDGTASFTGSQFERAKEPVSRCGSQYGWDDFTDPQF